MQGSLLPFVIPPPQGPQSKSLGDGALPTVWLTTPTVRIRFGRNSKVKEEEANGAVEKLIQLKASI